MSDTQSTPKPDDSASEPSTAVPPVVTWEISTRSIWQVIGAILLTLVGVILVLRARDLVAMLIISLFFSLALIPLVERLHKRYGWKRGAAVGAIYAAAAAVLHRHGGLLDPDDRRGCSANRGQLVDLDGQPQ